jgi:hypothetical protein
MLRSRLFHRLATWAAFVAVLMAALAPALSHALASRGDAGWVEVCTAEGSRWVQGSGGPGEPAAPAGAHALDHCGYCTLHTDDPALPGADQQAEPVPPARARAADRLSARRAYRPRLGQRAAARASRHLLTRRPFR